MPLDRDLRKPESRNKMEMERKSSFNGDRGGSRIARLSGDPRGLTFSDSPLRYRPLNLDPSMPVGHALHEKNDSVLLIAYLAFISLEICLS